MFNLDNYEPVEARIDRFWSEHPNGSVLTDIVEIMRTPDGKPIQYIVKATVLVDGVLMATGFAEEMVGASPVNRTSALENAETSAIGRALANANYAKQGSRPSREEMSKVMDAGPRPSLGSNPPGTPRSGPAAKSASEPASAAQVGKLRGLMKDRWIEESALADIAKSLDFDMPALGVKGLGKRQASALIDYLINTPAQNIERASAPVDSDPWASDAPLIDPMTGETAEF